MKINDLCVVFPVRIETDDTRAILFVDLASGRVFDAMGLEVPDELKITILDDVDQQGQTVAIGQSLDNMMKQLLDTQEEIMEGGDGGDKT